jgi:hypothetical protein
MAVLKTQCCGLVVSRDELMELELQGEQERQS